MTFSIIARDAQSGASAVATATGLLAVGAQVPNLYPRLGAIATQGFYTSPLYAEEGRTLLAKGQSADMVVKTLTEHDSGRAWRQLLVMDTAGRTAGWTGDANEAALGARTEADLAIGGNMLASDRVLDSMHAAYRENHTAPLAERVLAAMDAAERAGGDKRGTCSAALLVEEPAGWLLDLRVDYAKAPTLALRDLYRRSRDPAYQEFRARLPKRAPPRESL